MHVRSTRFAAVSSPLLAVVITSAMFACSSSKGGPGSLGSGGPDASVGADVQESLDTGGLGNIDFGTADGGGAYEVSVEAYFVNDPPPASCGTDSGVTPVDPGGTPACPDDKNLQGCPCTGVGTTAACWPGYRVDRDHGICHDGTTTCVADGEFGGSWGPCVGYQLPTGDAGASACTCFSGGQWAIANVEPCFEEGASGGVTGAQSSDPTAVASGSTDPNAVCPTPPPSVWSADTLKADCAGHFKLCYTLKAGDAKNPLATDCVLSTVCAESDYTTANVVQNWPSLPSWTANSDADATCANAFYTTGGYGEMSVVGTSVECDTVNKVFNRLPYCASSATDCSSGGSGSF